MAARSVRVKSDSTGAAPPSVTKAKSPSASKSKSAPVSEATSPVSKTKTASVSKIKSEPVSKAKPRKSRAKPKEQLVLTPIRVHYNVGLGNRITARGDTDPFRWDSGLEAQYADADVWELQLERVPAGQTFQFKPLINDRTYSTGENFVGTGGQTLDIYPVF
jgi:hypothetical protein